MQTFKSLIPFLLTASLAVNAETTSCVTSTKTFPTITSIIVEPTSTWSGNGTGGPYTVYTTGVSREKCQPRTTGVPPGFTSTVTVCNSCGEKPITATLTVPCPEATPTKGPGKPPKPQPEHCETCHDQGKPSGKPPVQPQPVSSAPAVKPVPTGPQPEKCTTCGGPKPPSPAPPQPPKTTNKPGEGKPENPNFPAGQQSQPLCSAQPSLLHARLVVLEGKLLNPLHLWQLLSYPTPQERILFLALPVVLLQENHLPSLLAPLKPLTLSWVFLDSLDLDSFYSGFLSRSS
ncbi:hypothetical protein NW765_013258 [Fusarium oxysporum]|nr:hypothetical protein NW765_013258 [Fusarium oxysporum]